MPVLVIGKFEGDPIKTEGATASTTFFWRSRASISEVNGRMLLELELVRDFMAAVVTSKFDDNTIKMKALLCPQPFLHY